MTTRVKHIYAFNPETKQELPLVLARIAAGFPSPADDFIEQKLDLNQYLIKHPAATFFVRVEGESMIDAGIRSGDILIVDKALEVADNKIIIAHINGEFTVKRIQKQGKKLFLLPESPHFEPLEYPESNFDLM